MSRERLQIEILLPTYNGELFLAEQLDSILNQRGDFDLHITVRDDGSTDSTRKILSYYESTYNVRVIYGTRIGVNASVMALADSADTGADLYAFSDQDDVWYDFRLHEAVTAIQSRETDKPLLWTCKEELTNEKLQVTGYMPYPKYLGNFCNAVIQNKTPGHTQVFNRALLDLFKGYPAEKIFVYDWVVYLLASVFGEVLYCPRSCGKYRQHGKNAIGFSPGRMSHLRRRLKRLFSGALKGIAEQQAYFLTRYGECLNPNDRQILTDFVTSRKRWFSRICFALTTRVKRDTWFESLQFRILYIFGAF